MTDQDQSWSVAVVVPIYCGYPPEPGKCPRLVCLKGVVLVDLLPDCCALKLVWKVVNTCCYVTVSDHMANLER